MGGSVGQLGSLRLAPVADKGASRRWCGLIGRWHYLGYNPCRVRDRWIGWQRPRVRPIGAGAQQRPLPHPAPGTGVEPRLPGLGAGRGTG